MSLCNGDELDKESRNPAAEVRNTITIRLLVTEFRQSINCQRNICRIGPYRCMKVSTLESF